MTPTATRILSRWKREFQGNTLSGGDLSSINSGLGVYSGSSVTDASADFLGDWRANDSWQRFDMWRVRNRSRQLERGNPWCMALKRALLNNVLGAKGFHFQSRVVSGKRFGDSSDGVQDDVANTAIEAMREEFGKPQNFTTRKKLSRRDADRLILSRLCFDGEVIVRKVCGFANDFNFSWQIIDPDYLDQNLNRVEPNGNLTKMGVELDATFKFPVAYWFLKRRPNDYFYNYTDLNQQRYIRVPAEEVFHIYVQTEDNEQTRGWPWIFAALLNLFRMGKFEEAALLNAAIGASRGLYYKKSIPQGFDGDPRELNDNGQIVQSMPDGVSAMELPYGVEPVTVDMRYPDAEFEPFRNAMMLGVGQAFGTSYATTTGDLSKANFVSSRLGQLEEREFYMSVQEFLIEHWKKPGHDEELFRAILAQKLRLPISKFEKFNQPDFIGRRWQFVQPVDEWKAKEIALKLNAESLSDIIRQTSQKEPEDVFRQIAMDDALMKKYGLTKAQEKDLATKAQESAVTKPEVS